MISVIGAGPIGSYISYLLAKNGEKVNLYEEHDKIGEPVQCTGVVSGAFKDIIEIRDKFLVNKFNFININFENEKIRVRNKNFLLDREKFDEFIFNMAKDEGVKVFLNSEFKGLSKGKIKINNKTLRFDKLIGADGPYSRVAKSIGLYKNRKLEFGIQARVKGEFGEEIDVFFDKGKFSWIVPEDNKIARVGIFGNMEEFKELIQTRKILEYQSGVVPVYDYKLNTMKGSVYLIGDAATQVKATTYGGLVPGFIIAKELNKAILENLNYHKLWKKKIGRELFLSLLMRRRLDRMSYDDKNFLFNLFKGKVKKVIEEYDRDFPSKFIIKLLIKEPKLIKFIFK